MRKSGTPRPSWKKEFFTFFGSLQLAIVLLLLIAAASIIGTLIPQTEGPGVIVNGEFHPTLKSVLLAIRAYDVYHAFWFNFLLATLFVNLAVCTYLRFPPTWRRYQMKMPKAPGVKSLQEGVLVGAAPDDRRLDMLRKRGYKLTALDNGEYFAEKNKFVRLGPTFIHISLFAIIAGAIMGGLTGNKNSVPMMVGESINSAQVHEESYIKGAFAAKPPSFDIRLDNFSMEFFPNGQVRQYVSKVTITPENGTPYQRTMWVNEPLIHEGVYFYQSFWGVGAFTYAIDGNEIKVPLTQAKVGGYMSRPFEIGPESYVYFLRSLNEPGMLISTKTFEPVAQFVPGVSSPIGGKIFEVKTYHLFSGLETKKDPGIPVVYFGCGVLLFGLAMVPFCHREVWVRKIEEGWVLAGRTHKGRVMLRKELEQIARVWGTETDATPVREEIGAKV